MKLPFFSLLIVASLLLIPHGTKAQEKEHLKLDSPFASYVETDFPFFGQTLDARDLGDNWPKDNLSPRGIILNLGHGHWACFDPDLLRLALVWKENADGEYLTMNSMAAGSYRLPEKKAGAGQKTLPKPIGTPLLANGIYPGWESGNSITNEDPRDRGIADEGEVGLGPLPTKLGAWKGLRLIGDGVQLEYEIAGTPISENISFSPEDGLVRNIAIGPHPENLTLMFGNGPTDVFNHLFPHDETDTHWRVTTHNVEKIEPTETQSPISHWNGAIELGSSPAKNSTSALAVDKLAIPDHNPWKRNVRLSGFDFFSDGRAALCTFDGDVWMVTGLGDDLTKVTWKRHASGLNEPMGLEIVDDEIYVFSRDGVVRLHDENADGEVDFYENFCNLVPQTAETREFAMDIYAKPGGGFYLAKGGQIGTTRGKANGTIVEISADGRSWGILATGMRQPYAGVDYETGLLTSSDQQGNWKPATPIYVIEKGKHYGFLAEILKDQTQDPASITDPAVWIPHFINQSGASQVWLRDAKMGSLNDSLIHLGFSRPEIFKIYLDERGQKRQGGVSLVLGNFSTGLLKGRVHPIDGSLWICGMKIWGTIAEEISGLYRIRPTGEPLWVPEQVLSSDRGVMLRFAQPVDPTIAGAVASYSVDRWNYKQTKNYGSGNYQLNGEPGQETVPVASVTISKDKRSVFLGIPDMQPVHTLRVSFRQPAASELPVVQHAFLTIYELLPIDLDKEGFATNEVDLTLKAGAGAAMAKVKPSIEIGKQMYQQYGCMACHTVDPNQVLAAPAGTQSTVAVGPTWVGLWGSKKTFADGSILREGVDEVYLRESIIDPARRVSAGFEMSKTGVGMPSYLGVLKDHEIDSIILYIKSLEKTDKKGK
ncbi:MAG: c-type cytochrome [Verrucomicrobiae bacterium]|nr:c-type cytochrome [Verrucomicrobiae bacterium]